MRQARFTATLDVGKQHPDVDAATLEEFVVQWNELAVKRSQPLLKIDDGVEEDRRSKYGTVLRPS